MRKMNNYFVFLLALLPFFGWAQQKNYDGQHVNIKRTTGDSIQYDISSSQRFKPIIKDGKIVWSFQNYMPLGGHWYDNEWDFIERFSVKDVEGIDFRSIEYDKKEARKALIEFYQVMNGDNWSEEEKENWCSDKPIWDWSGVNVMTKASEYPWVNDLWFGSLNNTVPTTFPECVSQMGRIVNLNLSNCNLKGELPSFLGNIFTLNTIALCFNNFTGTFPQGFEKIPDLLAFNIEGNQIEGSLPEEFILACMNNSIFLGNSLSLIDNNFTGKVPQSIQNHPRFADFWPGIVLQRKPLDISDLVIPAPDFTTVDVNGNPIDLMEIYKKNKYTLLYKWGLWCGHSEAYNQMLVPAYKAYKDKGLEIIGIHYDLMLDDGLENYVKDHDIPWNNTIAKDWSYGETGVGRTIFQWGGTPQVFLVDQNGNIVFNSLMDKEGNNVAKEPYHYELFKYLEEQLGPIEYNFYTSTDYSQDGFVNYMQTATIGQGIDLVFVGEGFTDKDDYSQNVRIEEAVDQFFAYEPYASLRDRFNVYGVKTISPNAEFFGNATHAIDEDISKALEYASRVPNLKPDRPMYVVVVYNNNSGGRSYCTMMEDNSFVCFAMDGVSTVLNHEAGGHGIGKLFDEYVEDGNESLSLPEENKTYLNNVWTSLGWGANVDWRSNPTEVKWAKFINDARYADEIIGVYEGSYLYQYGAYRPTENSMMRYNDVGFNAPSREEIYKRVMKESEGDNWTYDYETFVAFDAAGHSHFVNALSSNGARQRRASKMENKQLTAPPVFLKGTWRDALKNNKK